MLSTVTLLTLAITLHPTLEYGSLNEVDEVKQVSEMQKLRPSVSFCVQPKKANCNTLIPASSSSP